MSQQNETGVISITAGATRAAFLRVYNNSGTWASAGVATLADGVQQVESLATTDIVAVRLLTAPGTRKMTASGAISAGATVYAAAAGKIAATGTIVEGRAVEAATADGDIIEVIPLHNADLTGNTANTAGVGITGTAESFVTAVETIGDIYKTTIVIDLTGLNSGGTADDVIGADGAGVAHLGQITAAVNGTIVAGKLTCLETPATGDDDIDIHSATEATGVEDTAISALAETKLCNSGDLTAGTVVAVTPPAADQYLYLTGGTGGDATYTAGKLLIEFWGK